ncbi:MAG: efflux RND transporter periplasmic adaptor subunit [Thermaurantimonas sp.]
MPDNDQESSSNYILILIITFASLLGFTACTSSSAGSEKKFPAPLEVSYFVVNPKSISERFVTNAEILPSEQVNITSEVAAKVVSIGFEEGQLVKKGHILVQLDAREAIARLQSLEAQLEQAEKVYRRTDTLLQTGGASEEEFEIAKSRYLQLKAEASAASVFVEKHSIRAPFTGVAGLRHLSPGSFVSNQQSIVQFWQIHPLKIEIDLPERFTGLVRVGDTVEIFGEYLTDTTVAIVYAVEPVIDKVLRSNKIRAKIGKPSAGLFPGAYVKAALHVKSKSDVLKVPADCIVPQLGRQIVYTIKDDTARANTVQVGRRDAVYVEILSGLQPGDTVVASGILQIRSGTPVRPANSLAIQE